MREFRFRLAKGRWLGAWLLGAAVALFSWFSGNNAVFPPELWDEFSIAAGLRPPPDPMPGCWRALVSCLAGSVGLERTTAALQALGAVSLGVLAAFTYLFFGEMLPIPLRLRMLKWGWSRRVVRLLLMQGSLCFVLSYPVWGIGRALSPAMMQLLAGVIMLNVFCWSLRSGRPHLAMLMTAAAGLYAADSVFGFLLPVAFVAFVVRWIGLPGGNIGEMMQNPLLRYITFRRIFATFLTAWLVGVGLNTYFFWRSGGFETMELTGFLYFLHYLYCYLLEIGRSARPLGWLFIIIAVIAPFVLSVAFVRIATDDDKFLSYLIGFIFLVLGVFSFLQSTGWTSAWFWRWIENPEPVSSPFLLGFCLFLTSTTTTLSLCVVGVEFYFRSGNRIAKLHFEDAVEMAAQEWPRMVRSLKRIGRGMRAVLTYEPVFAVVVLALPRFASLEREMASVVNDCARQTAAECGTARLLFTDGMLDGAVEVAAAMEGRRLKALSMLGGDTRYDRHVRARGETDREDRDMLKAGASNTLRSWVRVKSERTTNIAVQVGLELWRRNGLEVPELGGLVARTAGFPKGEREKWIEAARRLARRVLDLHEKGEPDGIANNRLKDMFAIVEWRLSRMCRQRADADDSRGLAAESMREAELAEALDNRNVAYRHVRDQMEWFKVSYDSRLTPREGMTRGMAHGDFQLARHCARQILRSNPDDSKANFVMGMSYFVEEKFNRAEAYLKRSLEARPDEPAALNNLAIVQSKLGRFAEAETNAVKALKQLPGSKEITHTLGYIRRKLAK
ncbi:MAG: tetratricopeptide repeat protein [Kiritimatiellae bacterium]|nr:tetratricopeptide repeat protein [Kiritimatiellia bacterium]